MKPLFCIAALLASASLSACAQAPQPPAQAAAGRAVPATNPQAPAAALPDGATPDARARQALQTLNPQIQVDYIGEAPLPGFREVIVGGQLVYVSDDGKYLVQGTVVDIATQSELTQSSQALSTYRQDLLRTVKTSDRIVFAPPNAKYTVSIFTDIECGYCRKLHSEIAEYNRQGIAIEYLAFPRMGLGSKDHTDMISVWCAPDRRKALTDAKNGVPVPQRSCRQTPVDMQFNVGQRLGVSGTPAVYAPDGTQLGGYLPPAQMRQALDGLAAKAEGQSAGAP
jgi:thiol:disulfide interchange protein DsbC